MHTHPDFGTENSHTGGALPRNAELEATASELEKIDGWKDEGWKQFICVLSQTCTVASGDLLLHFNPSDKNCIRVLFHSELFVCLNYRLTEIDLKIESCVKDKLQLQ